MELRAEDQARLRQWTLRWNKVLQDSVIVDITITQWQPYASLTSARLASIGVKAETDDAKRAAAKVLHAGHIDLLPKSVYKVPQRAANEMRTNLAKWGHDVIWGKLVPAQSYEAWYGAHDALETEFNQGVNGICNLLERHKRQMRVEYVALFSDAYDRLCKMNVMEVDRTTFVQLAIEDLQSNIPTSEEIRAKYSINVSFAFAPMQDEIAAAEDRAMRIREESLSSQESMASERKRTLRAMHAEVAAQTEGRRNEVLEGLMAAEQAFYAQVSETVDTLRNGLKERDGRLLGRGSLQIKNMIEQVKTMNVFENVRLTEQIAGLEKVAAKHLAASPAQRLESMGDLQKELTRISMTTKAAVNDLPNLRGVRVVRANEDVEVDVAKSQRSVKREADQIDLDLPRGIRRRRVLPTS